MSISSVMSSGLQGLQAAINRTTVASVRIAGNDSDLATNIVGLRQGEIDAKIAANVIKTGDEILGTMIDIRG